MNNTIRQLAIIGPTASGKSELAITLAKKSNAVILSLDSLSIYKEINIVSAKPSAREQEGIPHYGIDLLLPDESFDVTIFTKLYKAIRTEVLAHDKGLIIVGGTSFYLKSMIDGISPLPSLESWQIAKIQEEMSAPDKVYHKLEILDPHYMQRIERNDRYRTEKALSILYATDMIPSRYFEEHPPIAAIEDPITVYNIATDKTLLRERIMNRTKRMIADGLIDEVASLEYRYSRTPNCMKAIGIKETLDYLDGRYDKQTLEEKIATYTARLAKRQTTFNRSQFQDITSLDLDSLYKMVLEDRIFKKS
jgi:tRNA dimethylallyltransferase